jgi:DNA end-binding protein Ku
MGVMTFPVKLYAATEDKDIDRHNLHEKCKQSVNQIKVCQSCLPETLNEMAKKEPLSAEIVSRAQDILGKRGVALFMPMTDDTMVKGYELTKGENIVVTEAELETIKVKSIKAVEILEFMKAAECDPRMPEKHYFVSPDKAGVKPFAIMLQAMKDTGLYAIGKVMMRSTTGKESLVMLRPFGDVLLLHTLTWPDELRDASEIRFDKVVISDQERALGNQLVEIMVGDGDLTKHHDVYQNKLVRLLLAKGEGKAIEAVLEEVAAPAGDVMDALMRSIELAKNKGGDGAKPVVSLTAEFAPATLHAGVGFIPNTVEEGEATEVHIAPDRNIILPEPEKKQRKTKAKTK